MHTPTGYTQYMVVMLGADQKALFMCCHGYTTGMNKVVVDFKVIVGKPIIACNVNKQNCKICYTLTIPLMIVV